MGPVLLAIGGILMLISLIGMVMWTYGFLTGDKEDSFIWYEWEDEQ